MTGERPIRLGILGCARIAPTAVLRPAKKGLGVEVVAIASRDKARAERWAAMYGIARVMPDYQALVEDPELDAIYNPLPVSLHAEWSIRALEAGKHVLCEKPIACNAQEAERMAAASARTGRILAEALHYRYHPLAQRLKELVSGGQIGAPKRVEARLCVPLVFPDPIRYRYDLGGGATMDVGCYAIHLCRFLVGEEPEVVFAQARLAKPQVDRWMQAELRFPSGVSGRVTASIFSAVLLRSSATIWGEKGRMDVLNPYAPHTVFHRIRIRTANTTITETVPGPSTYECQLRAFAAAIRQGEPLPTGSEDFVANMRVIDAVYQKAGLKPRGLPEAP